MAVSLSICHAVALYKMAESIEVLFRMETLGYPRYDVFDINPINARGS